MVKVKIPWEVDDQEILVRSLKHPFHINSKNQQPKEEAFMPRPGEKDISVIRLSYTKPDFCKAHSFTLIRTDNGEVFAGLGLIRVKAIREANSTVDPECIVESSATPIDAFGTPMIDAKTYYPAGTEVYTTDAGNPAHADIRYNVAPKQGVPNNPIRRLAKQLINRVKLKVDKNITDPSTWTGEPLELAD